MQCYAIDSNLCDWLTDKAIISDASESRTKISFKAEQHFCPFFFVIHSLINLQSWRLIEENRLKESLKIFSFSSNCLKERRDQSSLPDYCETKIWTVSFMYKENKGRDTKLKIFRILSFVVWKSVFVKYIIYFFIEKIQIRTILYELKLL